MEKRVTWKEIEKKYPDKWVFMSNVKRDHGSVVDCELICVVPFEEMADTMVRLKENGVPFERERTTESMPTTGVIL